MNKNKETYLQRRNKDQQREKYEKTKLDGK